MSEHHATNEIPDLDGNYDIYGIVHKGLRRAQCELLARLGRADFSDDAATTQLLGDLRALLALAAAHVEHEDHHIHSALHARGAVSTDKLDDQHDHHRAAFIDLERMIAAVEVAPAMRRGAPGRRLYIAFALYVGHDLEHMHEEETVTAPILWSLFTQQELLEIEMRIIGSLPPEKNMAFMRIMIPAISPQERAMMLGGMKQSAPVEVFNAVMQFAAKPNLSSDEFADLERRLARAA
ncbi:hypothetical protein [Paradevosia shaoguanensis]|uniref:hemerythrin domain-containing protein n=1 Tax=Paradevosia shaoguanensis TaxID=1335043 RepID=UPI0019337F37|nr:hypothetical protein [Paradevosia shaoguanensis]